MKKDPINKTFWLDQDATAQDISYKNLAIGILITIAVVALGWFLWKKFFR
jgi:hypothetical protein